MQIWKYLAVSLATPVLSLPFSDVNREVREVSVPAETHQADGVTTPDYKRDEEITPDYKRDEVTPDYKRDEEITPDYKRDEEITPDYKRDEGKDLRN